MKNPLNFKYQKKTFGESQAEIPTPEESVKKKKRRREPCDTAGKTENFFTRNVKAITFFVCLALFLTFLGPMSIFRIMEIVDERTPDGEIMQLQDILTLAEQHDTLTMERFTVYDGDKQTLAELGSYYRIRVDGRFLVTVGTERDDGRITYFCVTRMQTEEEIDVMSATFRLSALQDFLSAP